MQEQKRSRMAAFFMMLKTEQDVRNRKTVSYTPSSSSVTNMALVRSSLTGWLK